MKSTTPLPLLYQQLNQIEAAQLVRALDDRWIAYLFKHVLVQETTYASLLKNDRQRLHRLVAQTLEYSEPERLGENAARLLQHYAEAGDDEKTLEYAVRAGDYAASYHANAEAIEHYLHALKILARRGGTPEEYLHVYSQRGRALELLGEFDKALENYEALEEQGRVLETPALELAGLVARATIYATPTSVHDPQRGEELNARALELARELGDQRAECKSFWNLMLIEYFDSEPERAVEYGEKALQLARALGWQEQEAYILNDISRPLISMAPIARSLDSLAQARVLFQAQNNLPMLADNLAATSETLLMAGDYARAIEFNDQAIALNRTINSVWGLAYSSFAYLSIQTERGNLDTVFRWSRELSALPAGGDLIIFLFGARAWVMEAYLILGNIPRAVELCRSMAEWIAHTYQLGRGWFFANLVRALIAANELDEAQQVLADAYKQKLNEYSGMAPILVPLADAELALALQNPERALQVTNELLMNLERRDIQYFHAPAYALRGNAFAMQNAWDNAAAEFQCAQQFGAAIPSRSRLWEMYGAWANVETQRGNFETAATLLAQAREYILYIAEHAGDAELRERFLNLPKVHAVLSATE